MKRLFVLATFTLLLSPASAFPQLTMETVRVIPPMPTTADSISISIEGILNSSDLPTSRTEWKREGNHIRADVLIYFLGSGAPTMLVPYRETAHIGTLPLGAYDLSARVFGTAWHTVDLPYPDPWTFPETFPDTVIYTMTTSFMVVPEPPSLFVMFSAAWPSLHRLRRRPAMSSRHARLVPSPQGGGSRTLK
jgi:hypothetical protein